jgi:hypothetical protein
VPTLSREARGADSTKESNAITRFHTGWFAGNRRDRKFSREFKIEAVKPSQGDVPRQTATAFMSAPDLEANHIRCLPTSL